MHHFGHTLANQLSIIVINYLPFTSAAPEGLIGYWKLDSFDGLKDLSLSRNHIQMTHNEFNKIYDFEDKCVHLSKSSSY